MIISTDPYINQSEIVDTELGNIDSLPTEQATKSLRLLDAPWLTTEHPFQIITPGNLSHFFPNPESIEYKSLNAEFKGISSQPNTANQILIGKRINASNAYIQSGVFGADKLAIVNTILTDSPELASLTFHINSTPYTIDVSDGVTGGFDTADALAANIQTKVIAAGLASFVGSYLSQGKFNFGSSLTGSGQTIDYCTSPEKPDTGSNDAIPNYFASILGLTAAMGASLSQGSAGMTPQENMNFLTNINMKFMSFSALYDISNKPEEYLNFSRWSKRPDRKFAFFFAYPQSKAADIKLQYLTADLAYNDDKYGFTLAENVITCFIEAKDELDPLHLLGGFHSSNSSNLDPTQAVFPNMANKKFNDITLQGIPFTKAEKASLEDMMANSYGKLLGDIIDTDAVIGGGVIGGGNRYIDLLFNFRWFLSDMSRRLVNQEQDEPFTDEVTVDQMIQQGLSEYKEKGYWGTLVLDRVLDDQLITSIKNKFIGLTTEQVIDQMGKIGYISQTTTATDLDGLALVYLMGNDPESSYVQKQLNTLKQHGYVPVLADYSDRARSLGFHKNIPDAWVNATTQDRVFEQQLLENVSNANKKLKNKSDNLPVFKTQVLNKICVLVKSHRLFRNRTMIVGALPADVRTLGTLTTIVAAPPNYTNRAKIILDQVNQLI